MILINLIIYIMQTKRRVNQKPSYPHGLEGKIIYEKSNKCPLGLQLQ